ncbi:MAG: hypothetical protein NDJ90_10400 [Oligoflexia bacterium]|nr:hypothetical protein [Oligoflexia bacterium]
MRFLLRIACFALLGFLATTLRSLDSGLLERADRLPASPRSAQSKLIDSCHDIHKVVCQRKGRTRDPTGIVYTDLEGELMALRAYEEIIRAHPDWTVEQIDEELTRTIYTPVVRRRAQAAFRWVQRSLEQIIERQPLRVFPREEKRWLQKRLRETQLELPPPASLYADEPSLFTKNDVYYERLRDGRKRLRVGGAYLLAAKSWFNLIFTMAHELAHAIDPCEVRSELQERPLEFAAYGRLSACFLRNELIDAESARRECGPNDQLAETFADWLAARVSAQALANFATEFHGPALTQAITNSVRDLCEQDDPQDELDTRFHPAPEARIDRIFGRNPRIRALLGCGPPARLEEYCAFN